MHESVLIEAAYLGHDAPRLTVETAASQWLGQAWARAGMDRRHAGRDLVRALEGELGGPRDQAAYLALAALATIAAPAEHDQIQRSIASSGLRVIPSWAGGDPVVPQAAWRSSDVYGSVISIFVAYGGAEPHELALILSTVGGLWVEQIGVLEPGSHTFEGVTGTRAAAIEIKPDQALSEIAEALMVTDLYWPPQVDPDYAELRALAQSRSRGFEVDGDRVPISDDARHDLVESFVTENDGVAPQDVLRDLAGTFVDFGDGYLFGGVLAWSPGEVDRFLTDWVARKVILDADERAAVPEVLRAWLAFALRRRGLPEQDIAPVVAVVDELEKDFRDSFSDESAGGPAKRLMTALLDKGVDLADKEAVAVAIREYNAEQLAGRLQGWQE